MDKRCKNCKYFILHYIKYAEGKFSAINSGHCIRPNVKTKNADSKACFHWTTNLVDNTKPENSTEDSIFKLSVDKRKF